MLLKEERKRWYILIATLYIAYVFTMHKWGHQGDMLFWLNWSKYIFEHGFTHVYDNKECNYLPAYLYVLWGHVKLQGNTVDIGDNLYTIKFFTLIFDVAAAVLSVRFVKELKDKTYYFLLLMFNVAYIYNTVFWGQVDAIFTFWGFAALLLAIEQRVEWSILCLTIALNFKLQALVFIPVVGALLLPNFLTLKGMKKFLLAIIISFFIQIIILLPFILSGRLGQVWHVIIDSVGHYPFPTVGAFNLWTILLPNVSIEGMYKISDETKIGFLSYKQIGQFLFISTVLVSLYPLVNYLVKKYLKKNYSVFPIKNVFLIAALTSLNFYFFNTEMHERYSHPALVCLAAYAFLSKRFLPLILGSISYFLNMERICWYLNLHNDTYENGFLFKPRLIAGLYLILILLLYFLLYKKEKVKVKEEEAVLN